VAWLDQEPTQSKSVCFHGHNGIGQNVAFRPFIFIHIMGTPLHFLTSFYFARPRAIFRPKPHSFNFLAHFEQGSVSPPGGDAQA
jgi:hypothetical protein